MKTRRGFTLIEILIAMAIAAMVVVAMSTLIFSMGELWGRNTDLRLFELHVRNVSRYLESELATAALPPLGGANGVSPLSIQDVRTQSGLTESLLTYELPNGNRLCTWPDRPLPNVVYSLTVREGEGLVMLWHSRLEKTFDTDAPRETVVTPLVTAMTYDYFDPDFKTWKNEPVLRKDNNNQGIPPQRLRLTFTYSGRTIESVIPLPSVVQGLPVL